MVDMDPWAEAAAEEAGTPRAGSSRSPASAARWALPGSRPSLDVRYEARRERFRPPEFSWQGFAGGEPCSGRGWVAPGTAGRLVGHVFIHDGGETGFVGEPWW